jgi:hypothetical protein
MKTSQGAKDIVRDTVCPGWTTRNLVQAERSLDPAQQSPLASGQPWTLRSDRYKQDDLCPQPYPYQHLENKNRDGLRNVGFYIIQPRDPADSPRELYYTHSPGKHQNLHPSNILRSYEAPHYAVFSTLPPLPPSCSNTFLSTLLPNTLNVWAKSHFTQTMCGKTQVTVQNVLMRSQILSFWKCALP